MAFIYVYKCTGCNRIINNDIAGLTKCSSCNSDVNLSQRYGTDPALEDFIYEPNAQKEKAIKAKKPNRNGINRGTTPKSKSQSQGANNGHA